jgi:hypothetical protein
VSEWDAMADDRDTGSYLGKRNKAEDATPEPITDPDDPSFCEPDAGAELVPGTEES